MREVTIILIDDQTIEKSPLIVKLRQIFSEVVLFNKPKEGIDFVAENLSKKIIVILDIKFPDATLDGHGVLEKIKDLSQLIPVILWSAVDEKDETFSDFINNNAFAFLKQTTPVNEIVKKTMEAVESLDTNIAAAIEEWIIKREKFNLDKPYMITLSNGKQYTLNQILDEVRRQTPLGKTFSKDLNILTIDLLLRGKKRL